MRCREMGADARGNAHVCSSDSLRPSGGAYFGCKPMLFAVSTNQKDIVEEIYNKQPQRILDVDKYGNSVLHVSVLRDLPAMYAFVLALVREREDKMALNAGEPPSPLEMLPNYEGLTPIALAAAVGKPKMFTCALQSRTKTQVRTYPVSSAPARDVVEGKGPQRRPQKRLDRRLGEVAQAVRCGYYRLQMPLRLTLGVRGTVTGHRLGALEGGGLPPLPSNASLSPPPPRAALRAAPPTWCTARARRGAVIALPMAMATRGQTLGPVTGNARGSAALDVPKQGKKKSHGQHVLDMWAAGRVGGGMPALRLCVSGPGTLQAHRVRGFVSLGLAPARGL